MNKLNGKEFVKLMNLLGYELEERQEVNLAYIKIFLDMAYRIQKLESQLSQIG